MDFHGLGFWVRKNLATDFADLHRFLFWGVVVNIGTDFTDYTDWI